MLYLAYLKNPAAWAVLWVLHVIGYFGILRKMHLKKIYALIPFAAEQKIGDTMFETKFAFLNPFILAVLFAAGGLYLHPLGRASASQKAYGTLLLFFAFLNYYGYLVRLYWRLGNAFGKKFLFKTGMILVPAPFLLFLGFRRKNVFLHGTPIRLTILRSNKIFRFLTRSFSSLCFVGEALLVMAGIAYVVARNRLPWIIIQAIQNETYKHTKDIVSDHTEVDREENMGQSYASFTSISPSRAKFYPDHASDQSVVVMEYVIGADLEDRIGAASTNIRQFVDATKQGSALTFVMEAGGSQRWFTGGLKNHSVGRYVIRDGKIETALEMDSYTSMSDPDELASFIQWTKENYPADRYMLVLWDHGAGLSLGYGIDDLNPRKDENGKKKAIGSIDVDEIAEAIGKSGVRFDMIGFDACLMQDIEVAYALEPYADYYLASEETEPAGGWYYTSGFGMLAKDPTISTEEFGRELIGCYDQYNKAISEGREVDTNTLSLVDLTYVKPAYEKLSALFEKKTSAILDGESNYVDISLAANSAYTFYNKEQIDAVSYLENLRSSDYDDTVVTDEEIDALISHIKACVVARNRRSAKGINGMAVTFPYQMISSYTSDYNQLKSLGLDAEETFYSNYFSIMAASNTAPMDEKLAFLEELIGPIDYSEEPWYIKGFETYVTEVPMIDIPIHQNGKGYSLDLSDEVWNIISDAKQFYYLKTDQGFKYLGMDYTGAEDAQGHPMITTDGTWISIDGQPIYYEPSAVRETEEGTVFTGISKAMLNGDTEIILYIEWEPVNENSEGALKGRITGYDEVSDENAFMAKGTKELEPGETLDFLFDYCDEDGKVIDTRTNGKTYRVIQTDIAVTDESLGSCTLKHGIVLTDVYQRKFQTEMVETIID